MDQILAKASNQAVTFAIRSGISLASGYAIKTVSRLLDRIPASEQRRLQTTKTKIQSKINILSVSIDLVKLAAARGNTTLEATLELIGDLNAEFDVFDETVSSILDGLTSSNEKESIKRLEGYMEGLLRQINDAIPIVTLSLVTSGVNLNGQVSVDKISPGRLLQAASYLQSSSGSPKYVGPVFDLVMYSIFYNPSRLRYINGEEDDGLSAITWKEEFARASVRIREDSEFQYTFEITEDHDDGRYHEEEPSVKKYPLKAVERMFFSASGKLLKLEDRSSPVLIIKLVEDSEEWIALGELHSGEFDDDEDDEEDSEEEKSTTTPKELSLSLLEYLLRLSKLQQVEHKSILAIKDETLSLYLRDQPLNTLSNPMPKSKKEKVAAEVASLETKNRMEHTSNIERIKSLNIKENDEDATNQKE